MRALRARDEVQGRTRAEFRGVVSLQSDRPARVVHRPLHAQQVRLSSLGDGERKRRSRVELGDADARVLIDLHGGGAAVHSSSRDGTHQRTPPVGALFLGGGVRAVVGLQSAAVWHYPHLDESQGLGRVEVVLGVTHAATRGHELHRAASEGLGGAHRILVGQGTLHDVRADLHVLVAVRPEPALWLDEVVIHHAKHAELAVLVVVVLGEGEVETALEPIGVRPSPLVPGRIRWVSEPLGGGLRDEKPLSGNLPDVSTHVGETVQTEAANVSSQA